MLKNLSSSELIQTTKALATQERSLTAQVIERLEEIESRRLHLEMGYSSMHDFAMGELGYCKTSAHHRVSAMRLTRQAPEARTAIEDGRLSLTNLSQVHAFMNHEKKLGKTHSIPELLKSIENKSTRDCVKLLAAISPAYIPKEKVRVVSESETEIRFVASDELMAEFDKIKKLLSHQMPNPTYAELFKKMAELTVAKLDPPARVPAQEPVGKGRYIPRVVRKRVRALAGEKCSFVDPKSGHRCNSEFQLEIDHIHPHAMGGSNQVENLRLLCRVHNGLEAVRAYGSAKMDNSRVSAVSVRTRRECLN